MDLIALLAVIALSVDAVLGQGSCSGGQRCVDVMDCSPLLLLLKKPMRTLQELERLRESICGFVGKSPQVCCPENTCRTADGEAGSCVSLFECPHMLALVTDRLEHVSRSACLGPAAYSVCCAANPPSQPPSPALSLEPHEEPGQCPVSALPPPPNSNCCGQEEFNGPKITGGAATELDEYPWLVLIEYHKNNRIKLPCAGSLISSRYVLTTANCLTGPVLNLGNPVNVRLGEFDTNSELDCVGTADGGQDCADPVAVLPIERYVPHPEFDHTDRTLRNDIGIIRLGMDAPYTDFIRPICLPTTDLTLAPPDNLVFWAAGWGAVNSTISSSRIKLHLDLPFSPLDQCQLAYNNKIRKVRLWNKQLCAGGVENKDTCKGDTGGPLMYKNDKNFEVVGLVSLGPAPCGLAGVPGVYTKVYDYLEWIRSEMHI